MLTQRKRRYSKKKLDRCCYCKAVVKRNEYFGICRNQMRGHHLSCCPWRANADAAKA